MLSISPDWKRRGVRPKWAPTVRERLNRLGSSTAALNVNAEMAPTPGTVMSRRQMGSSAGHLAYASVHLQKCSVEHQSRIEQRQQGVG